MRISPDNGAFLSAREAHERQCVGSGWIPLPGGWRPRGRCPSGSQHLAPGAKARPGVAVGLGPAGSVARTPSTEMQTVLSVLTCSDVSVPFLKKIFYSFI